MLYKCDTKIVTILQNIYAHMKDDYDYFLIISGDTGTGKSRFALDLLETWYRVILKQPVTEDMISHISQDYKKWLQKFGKMQPYDMNIYDEGSRDLNSLNFMTRISKDINKLFDTFRSKRFFSVVILPNYFRLNKSLREDRLRGLVWIPKRKVYRFYTKNRIKYLNGYNEKRRIKSMWLARPFHQYTFPDYKGILLKPYLEQKNSGVDEVLKEILGNLELDDKKGGQAKTLVEIYKDRVDAMIKDGILQKQIIQKLNIGYSTLHRCRLLTEAEKTTKAENE